MFPRSPVLRLTVSFANALLVHPARAPAGRLLARPAGWVAPTRSPPGGARGLASGAYRNIHTSDISKLSVKELKAKAKAAGLRTSGTKPQLIALLQESQAETAAGAAQASAESDISKLSVKELKAKAKAAGLRTSGTKPQLIALLQESQAETAAGAAQASAQAQPEGLDATNAPSKTTTTGATSGGGEYTQTKLEGMKIMQLSDILTERGVETSGLTKDALINRILALQDGASPSELSSPEWGEDNLRGEDNLGEWGAGMGVSEHPTEAVDSSSQDFDWTAAQDSWGSGWSSAENDNEYNDESDNGGFFGPGSFKHRLKAARLKKQMEQPESTSIVGRGAWKPPLAKDELDALMHVEIRSLYKRCLRSAQRCPDPSWMQTMYAYVRTRFRDVPHDALAAVRIAAGETELAEMELYHDAREAKAQEESRREGRA